MQTSVAEPRGASLKCADGFESVVGDFASHRLLLCATQTIKCLSCLGSIGWSQSYQIKMHVAHILPFCCMLRIFFLSHLIFLHDVVRK
jgi:hypothetical protein